MTKLESKKVARLVSALQRIADLPLIDRRADLGSAREKARKIAIAALRAACR